VPTELCLAGRELTSPLISPDASTVAFVSREAGDPSAVRLVSTTGGPERVLDLPDEPTGGRGLNGGCLAWDRSGRRLAVVGRAGLWIAEVGNPSRLVLSADVGSIASPVWSVTDDAVIVTVDAARVLRVDLLGDGEPRRLDEGNHDFVADPEVWADDGIEFVAWQAWSVPDMPWDGASLVVLGPAGTVDIGRPSVGMQQPRAIPDGSLACLRDDSGWLNLWRSADPAGDWEHLIDEPVEHGGPSWGPGQRTFVGSPDGTRIAFTRNEEGFGRLCVLEVVTGAVTELGRGVHGHLSWAGGTIVALRSGARTPTQIVAYEVADGSRVVLATGPADGWDRFDPPEPELHEVVAPDGLGVPVRRYAAGLGRVLIAVHGGPTDQWQVSFLPRVIRWWSEGWDVLVCDPRGSTGHGRAHTDALRGGWGRSDTDDVLAVARHAQEAGWARRETTVVMGSSSGGLVVLNALVGDGPVSAGIALYPVSDLAGLAEHTHRFEAHYTDTLVGPPGSPALAEHSPISNARELSGRLLLIHGTDDPVVPVEHSRRLAAATDSRRLELDVVELDGEGHGFRRPENRRLEYDLVERFLTETVRRADSAGRGGQ